MELHLDCELACEALVQRIQHRVEREELHAVHFTHPRLVDQLVELLQSLHALRAQPVARHVPCDGQQRGQRLAQLERPQVSAEPPVEPRGVAEALVEQNGGLGPCCCLRGLLRDRGHLLHRAVSQALDDHEPPLAIHELEASEQVEVGVLLLLGLQLVGGEGGEDVRFGALQVQRLDVVFPDLRGTTRHE